jgi:transcriptional regulator with GAF, ATPase, and Fis domain
MLESKPFVTQDGLDAQGLADPAWIGLHGIQSFAALPMRREGVGVGVFAVFCRRRLTEGDVRGLTAAAALLAPVLEPNAGPRVASLRLLVEIEREAIERTLATTGGRVSGPRGAARILGLKPTTLQSRMKKIGVQRPPR